MADVRSTPARWLILSAFAAIYLIWGSTYLGIRFALETLPPFLLAGTRFVVAGGVLITWMFARGVPLPSRIHWRSAVIVGALMILGGNGGVTWSEQHVPSGVAALVVGAVPLWVVLLHWLVFDGPRPSGRMTWGLVTGFAGMLLLIGPADLGGGESIEPIGIGALLLAALCWSTGSLYARQARLPETPLMATGMEMLAGGVLQFLVGTASGEWSQVHPDAISLKSGLALAYLTFFGSLIGFSAYVWLLRHTTPARAASYAYVNPVVAVLLGWLLANEALTLRTLVAAGIIIGSVVMITTYRPPERPRPVLPGADDRLVPDGVGSESAACK